MTCITDTVLLSLMNTNEVTGPGYSMWFSDCVYCIFIRLMCIKREKQKAEDRPKVIDVGY